jgi:hypothetical protein
MFTSIGDFATANAKIIWLFISIALAIFLLSQPRFRFWLHDLWYKYVGVRTLSKDTTSGNNGWRRSEDALCSSYKKYIVFLEKNTFAQRVEYLRKSSDDGQTPIPVWVLLLLFVLVVAESLGFSYMLGSAMAAEGSENTILMMMAGITFVFGVLLPTLTHAAGHQYRRTSLLRECFNLYKGSGSNQSSTRIVALDDDQSIDNDQPSFVQIANRVAKRPGDRGSYFMVITAFLVITGIAVGSTYMRYSQYQHTKTIETMEGTPSFSDPSDPFKLPAEVAQPQAEADAKGTTEVDASADHEKMSAFIMLAIIFVLTQVIGIGAGYKYGFVGRKSSDAYKEIDGFSSYKAYQAHYRPYKDLVNARLKALQQLMEEHSPNKLTLTKTFQDYLDEHSSNDDESVQTKPEPKNDTPRESAAITAEQAKVDIEAITNPDERTNYFRNLPANIKEVLLPWVKELKEKEAKAKVKDVEEFSF